MTRSAKVMWGVIGVAAILLMAGIVAVAGFVILIDRSGQVESAAIVASPDAVQPLARLPGGVFVTIARLEGEIAIRCRGGARWQGGYVTPHMNSVDRVSGPQCRID